MLTSTGPIEFTVSAENSNYIDLTNSFLYVHAIMTIETGVKAEGVETTHECNFLQTLWSQIDVYLNGLLVTQSNNNYPYRAYIENLLSFGEEAKTSQLLCPSETDIAQFSVLGDLSKLHLISISLIKIKKTNKYF